MKITVGKPIFKIKHKNEYELEVTGMSGDADAYNKNSIYFKNTDEDLASLEMHLIMLEEFKKVPSGYHNDDQPQLDFKRRFADRTGPSTIESYDPVSLMWDLVGSDVTSEGLMASLEGYELFYHDANGIKHKAEVEL